MPPEMELEKILAQFPGPVALSEKENRSKTILSLCFGFLLVSFLGWAASSNVFDLYMRVLSGVCAFVLVPIVLLGAMSVGNPPAVLKLTRKGFEVQFGHFPWQEVSDIEVVDVCQTQLVAFNYFGAEGAARWINRFLTSHNSSLPVTYGLEPAELCKLMRDWRERALEGR